MPRLERKTVRRGRSAVPRTFARTRRWRRRRPSLTVRLGTLADLSPHVLALVADALALVGLGRAHLADLGGRLPDDLLVRAIDDHLRRLWDVERHAVARGDRDGVREADGELELRALELRAIPDALDLEVLLEAVRDALDHVRDERPREPVERAVLAALGGAGHGDDAVLLRDPHADGHALLERAERPRDLHVAAGRHFDGDAGGDLDWLPTDSAHGFLALPCGLGRRPPTRRTRAPRRRRRALRPGAW